MDNTKGDVIPVGATVYHPRIDAANVGFVIEQIQVLKHNGPSKHPSGTYKIVWQYGNIQSILDQEAGRERKYKIVLRHNCYYTIEECIEFLEVQRKILIESQKQKREQALGEIVELKEMLAAAKVESLQVSRQVKKNVSMLQQFDVRRDLERRGIIW